MDNHDERFGTPTLMRIWTLALGTRCPRCASEPGQLCTIGNHADRRSPHPERMRAAVDTQNQKEIAMDPNRERKAIAPPPTAQPPQTQITTLLVTAMRDAHNAALRLTTKVSTLAHLLESNAGAEPPRALVHAVLDAAEDARNAAGRLARMRRTLREEASR